MTKTTKNTQDNTPIPGITPETGEELKPTTPAETEKQPDENGEQGVSIPSVEAETDKKPVQGEQLNDDLPPAKAAKTETTQTDEIASATPTDNEGETTDPSKTVSTDSKDESGNGFGFQQEANELMRKMRIEKIYRTNDGHWFSGKNEAETHGEKLGSTPVEFTLIPE